MYVELNKETKTEKSGRYLYVLEGSMRLNLFLMFSSKAQMKKRLKLHNNNASIPS